MLRRGTHFGQPVVSALVWNAHGPLLIRLGEFDFGPLGTLYLYYAGFETIAKIIGQKVALIYIEPQLLIMKLCQF